MSKKKAEYKRINNAGSTLIIVLVAVAFMVLLAAIIISVSSANLRMKQLEYASKKNFYSDEQVLDEVYSGIGKSASNCMSKAYSEVLSQVTNSEGNGIYSTQDAAYKEFSRKFVEYLNTEYPEGKSTDTAYQTDYVQVLAKLNAYSIKSDVQAQVLSYSEIKIKKNSSNTPEQLVFKDIQVKYNAVTNDGTETATGYEATITTDIVIDVPYINFFQSSTQIMDYVLVGNQGLYFKNGTVNVNGNIYGGIGDDTDSDMTVYQAEFYNTDVYGGINFYNSQATLNGTYLVSKGDMNIRKSNLNIGDSTDASKTNLWVESIRLIDTGKTTDEVENPKLSTYANLFVANDLELNARESEAVLNGTYYGYNNGTYATQEKTKLANSYVDGTDGNAEHTTSSAMIINGNKAVLDLSGLSSMIVSGVAYVDLRSDTYKNGKSGKIEEYATAESLALKSNQFLYLAPADCLKVTNPATITDVYPDDGVWSATENWFGITGGFVDTDNPITVKYFSSDSKAYRYFYLNFVSTDKKIEYANLILNMVDPENISSMPSDIYEKYHYASYSDTQLLDIWETKQSIEAMAVAADSAPTITMADDTTASIYTAGTVACVADGKENTSLVSEDSAISIEYIQKVQNNIQKHYKYLFSELDPMETFSLTSDTLSDYDDLSDEKPVSKFVTDASMLPNGGTNGYKCNSGYTTKLLNGDATITSPITGIIICDGDLTIQSVNITGLVIATGKITIEGNATITADQGVVQAIISEEQREEAKKKSTDARNANYASTYLTGLQGDLSEQNNSDKVTGTDYTDYINYENWRKGEID